MTRTIDLPNLSSLYGRAALSAVKSKLSSNGSLRGLQVQPVVAQHPGITEEQLEDYRRLFAGEAFDRTHRSALPSVLIHIAAFPVQMGLMSGRDFPLALLGMVHLANTVEHHQPIMANTPLQILVDAKNFRPHRKGTQVDITVDVYPQGVDVDSAEPSALLWSGVSTYLGIGSFVAGRPEGEQARRGQGGFTPPKKTAQWNLSAGAGRDYAAVSGDYNPIHVSNIAAKALGQRGVIVHGMYSAARMLEGREPESAGHRWSIEFEAPVALPAKVAFAAENVSPDTQHFTGWDARNNRRHFTGELVLP
ncbi:MAG: MaoC/PaaZ C-terminal domain-containing protein [Nesterenkonia sp.]